jgi:hypothetical protein
MESTEGLKESHAETGPLDGVENSEPEPEARAEVGTADASPRKAVALHSEARKGRYS